MRPSPKTWHRFLDHLDGLLTTHRLTQDEVTAIIVSAVSDQVLKDAELDDSGDDMDAVTLDEVVERVKADYGADAERRVCEIQEEYESRLAEVQAKAGSEAAKAMAEARAQKVRAEVKERSAAEVLRRHELAVSFRARRWAKRMVACVYWFLVAAVMAGEVAILLSFPFTGDWLGILIGVGVVVATGVGAVGLLRHLSELRIRMEEKLQTRLRNWLLGRNEGADEEDSELVPPVGS
jgi:capsular polysaccharide biosynthesis protein